MKILYMGWQKFKENADEWFFYAFLLFFPLSIRKILYFVPVGGEYNEFASAYIYASDIFLAGALVSWLIILYNNYIILSSINRTTDDVPRGTFPRITSCFGKICTQLIHSYYLKIPFALVLFSFLSTLWAEDKYIAIFRSIKLLEMFLLYVYVYFKLAKEKSNCSTWNNYQNAGRENVPRGTFKDNLLFIIAVSGLFHSIFAIAQFLAQKSLGFYWLKESIISINTVGVAKIILNGDIWLRSYGLLPHPNVLGGFLFFTIIITVFFFELLRLKLIVPRGTINKSIIEIILRKPINKRLILGIQVLALILTFSKTAILGLVLALIYISHKKRSTVLLGVKSKCSTWNIGRTMKVAWAKMFHVEHFKAKLIYVLRNNIYKNIKIGVIVLGFILIFALIKPNIDSLVGRSIKDRVIFLNVSRGTFIDNPVLGVGSGQYVINLLNKDIIEKWQYQPVHNVFLLILNEFGIVGFFIVAVFIFKLISSFENVPRGTFSKYMGNSNPTKLGQKEEINQKMGMEEKCSTWNISANKSYEYKKNIEKVFVVALFVGLFVIALFDHYLWTIQQGQVLLSLGMAFLIVISKKDRRYII